MSARDVIKLQLINDFYFIDPFYKICLHLASALVHKQFQDVHLLSFEKVSPEILSYLIQFSKLFYQHNNSSKCVKGMA